MSHLVLNGTDNPLFCCNSCSLCCIALLTTDGAIFHSKGTGDRLLAVWHKIKIQILLEKLTCNRTLLFSVYHVSVSLSNDQKNLSGSEEKPFAFRNVSAFMADD